MTDRDDFRTRVFGFLACAVLVDVLVVKLVDKACRNQVPDNFVDGGDQKIVLPEVHDDRDSHDALFAELESEVVFVILIDQQNFIESRNQSALEIRMSESPHHVLEVGTETV